MVTLKKLSSVMAHPTAYRLWQAPFAASKFAPIFAHNDVANINRVLDVGCGPGTNAGLFEHADYLGLDINPKYIELAKQKFQRDFLVADVCEFVAPENQKFDFILLNSLLHHIDDENVSRILAELGKHLTPDGSVHILELVLPAERCIARLLAKSDRGDYARPMQKWRSMFEVGFDIEVFEPYNVGWLCGAMWQMVYFKGRSRQ